MNSLSELVNSSLSPLANIALAALIFLALGFAFLVYRQAKRMNVVLPTPLAPWIIILVIAYGALTLVACFLAVGVVVSNW